MKKFGEPCVECIGFTICAPDIACNSQTCNFFRKALEGVQTQPTNTTKVETVKRCNECRFWKDCRMVRLCDGNFFQRA